MIRVNRSMWQFKAHSEIGKTLEAAKDEDRYGNGYCNATRSSNTAS